MQSIVPEMMLFPLKQTHE